MPKNVPDGSTCHICKGKLVFKKTITCVAVEYDNYQCPGCKIEYGLNWHRLGEPERQVAVEVAA